MIEEVVQVSRIEGDEIWISADRQSACGACSAKKGCGQGALSDWMSGQPVEMSVINPAGLLPSVGQSVVIGLEEGSLMRASLLVYLVPLLMLVAFAVVARTLGAGEGAQVLLGIAGLIAGFIAVRWFTGRADGNQCYRPVLLRLA
jgi:sigma-E factor negative regulatory protein RseC